MRTRVAVTTEESSPGVPLWGANQVVTELPPGETQVALENLIAGRRYHVRTWNEDEFGNKSPELYRVIDTATPTKTIPLTFSAQGFLDEGSPMRAFVKVPNDVKVVSTAAVTLAFRQFMAPAQAATAVGTQTSNTDGSSTTPSGGASTTVSGGGSTTVSGGGSTSGASSGHNHSMFIDGGASGPAGASRIYTATGSGPGFYINTLAAGSMVSGPEQSAHNHTTPNHQHATPNHQHATPSHTHDTPSHAHNIAGHGHALTYGTFEEAYPASHNVEVRLYRRDRVSETWVLIDTQASLTGDLVDLDFAGLLDGPGDWRFEVQSAAGQPNDGRLGLDLYGALEVII